VAKECFSRDGGRAESVWRCLKYLLYSSSGKRGHGDAHPYMLKKKNRLPASCFKEKFPENRRNRLFSVRRRLNGLALSRFAVVISKKTEKSAARRNRVRRKIYEWLRKEDLERAPGRDTVISVSPDAMLKNKDGAPQDISSALQDVLEPISKVLPRAL
jgi:ribonuclease P protein component